MTEKRFYVAESNLIDGYCVFDRKKKYAFTPRPRKADCLNDTHTLNELNDENKQLKLQYSELEITLMNNQLAYIDLNDENKKLKNEVTLLDMKLADKEKAFEKLHKMYIDQIKENKELKNKINTYKSANKLQQETIRLLREDNGLINITNVELFKLEDEDD